MKAGLRLGIAVFAAGIVLAGPPALAQDVPPPAATTPATDAVGPRELQNFSLEGTVTRPAEPAPDARTATPAPSRAPATSRATSTAETRTRPAGDRAPGPSAAAAETPAEPASQPARSAERRAEGAPAPSVTMRLPPATTLAAGEDPQAIPTAFPADSESAATLARAGGPSLWPWLLAAMALGAGAAFLFRRNRAREAYAGGPQVDAFVAPQPAPPRVPAAAPPAKPAAPEPFGVVATRLRPWVEIGFKPLRCVVQDDRVLFDFEVDLYNSGSAPARDVLIEAGAFNASPTQDREIGGFYENPVGEGERIPAIQPLKRLAIRTQVAMPRENVRVLEAGGRKVFVPLMAFNALYRWSSGEGQSSVSYLVGRETKGEKLAPFGLDNGPRAFAGLGARELPLAVRH